jgi:hypothetical protein
MSQTNLIHRHPKYLHIQSKDNHHKHNHEIKVEKKCISFKKDHYNECHKSHCKNDNNKCKPGCQCHKCRPQHNKCKPHCQCHKCKQHHECDFDKECEPLEFDHDLCEEQFEKIKSLPRAHCPKRNCSFREFDWESVKFKVKDAKPEHHQIKKIKMPNTTEGFDWCDPEKTKWILKDDDCEDECREWSRGSCN